MKIQRAVVVLMSMKSKLYQMIFRCVKSFRSVCGFCGFFDFVCFTLHYLHKIHKQIKNSFVCFLFNFLIFFLLNLDLSNNETRHQTIRILNKLCVQSADGYEKTLEIFEFNKVVHFFFFHYITLLSFFLLKQAKTKKKREKMFSNSIFSSSFPLI